MEQENQYIIKNINGSRTVTLQFPITAQVPAHGGGREEKTFESVTFRQFSFGDLKALGNLGNVSQLTQGYWLMKTLSNAPETVFDKIEGVDLENCMAAVEGFLPQSLRT
jgi:hypothetical protein